jgi:hypothetical protein
MHPMPRNAFDFLLIDILMMSCQFHQQLAFQEEAPNQQLLLQTKVDMLAALIPACHVSRN